MIVQTSSASSSVARQERASATEIVGPLGQARQLALLLVRVAGLLSEEAKDQQFVVGQQLKLP